MTNSCVIPSIDIDVNSIKITNDIREALDTQGLYVSLEITQHKIISIYSKNQYTLSQVVPILDSLGLTVLDNFFYTIIDNDTNIFTNFFSIEADITLLQKSKNAILDVLSLSLMNKIGENNQILILTLLENFNARELLLSLALINYQWQLSEYNGKNLTKTFIKYHDIFREFITYFKIKFEPNIQAREKVIAIQEENIEVLLRNITNINDDKIFKLMFAIIKNIVRTNYYIDKECISFKVQVQNLGQYLKGIQPSIEAFVYHQYLSGVHLRVGKVSRGGLRWSDRHDDFRIEVKSLMTTQDSKNSIIVPNGAKGGFVIREKNITKEVFDKYYSMFVDALLDLIDKYENDTDDRIIKYDGEDRYFVVAADKGTSAMSDTANSIAINRGFWLQDAFASGGSNGYNHKALGITAKGAIKSTQRFFIEKGVDFYKEQISVVGIGSMSGDVFGNGLLESKYFRLVGAISSSEIFVDPNPDIDIAYAERQRLFGAKNGKWSDYDKSKISKGGGVYSKDTPNIELSQEIQNLLHTTKSTMSGEELAQSLLKLDVDLIFNGGVGTYFKASFESNSDINDKQNEFMRINGDEIKAYAVCEGGNLGFSQNARIEYAKKGGKINMDSIDNSAGVDTSDHEVNIKIALNLLQEKHLIDQDTRKEIFVSLTQDVVKQVLWTNYFQSLSISLDEIRSSQNIDNFIKVLDVLENSNINFKRRFYAIPTNEEFAKALTKENTIVRPILCTMLSFAKLFVTQVVANSNLVEDVSFKKYLHKYFPKSFSSIYIREIDNHPLKKEIIAMVVANKIINHNGCTFIADFFDLGLEKFVLKIKSYLVINQLFVANDVRYAIYRNDYQLDYQQQYKMLLDIENTIKHNLYLGLKYLNERQLEHQYILEYKNVLFEYFDANFQSHTDCTDDKLEEYFKNINYLRFAIITIFIKENSNHNYKDVTSTFYYLIHKLDIMYLLNLLDNLQTTNKLEKELKIQLRQKIENITISFTNKLLHFKRKHETSKELYEHYVEEKNIQLNHILSLIDDTKNNQITIINLVVIINGLDLAIE